MIRIVGFLLLFLSSYYYSQCNSYTSCNPNAGLYSGNNPDLIEYDNMIVGFHTSIIRNSFNEYKIWGSNAANNGVDSALSPQFITKENYPNLEGEILKVALGSNLSFSQFFVLTTKGLFVGGKPGTVLSTELKSYGEFGPLTINGKTDGLPENVSPTDVKMLFASTKTLILTTCQGNVYVLTDIPYGRGNGLNGDANNWAQVMENEHTPLTNVIVTRGQGGMGFALKKDGSLWTWGSFVSLGFPISQNFTFASYATKMNLPAEAQGVKMIQATASGQGAASNYSYYLLDQKNTLYVLGMNINGILGSPTPAVQKTWTKGKFPDNSFANNVAWISANEHDLSYNTFGLVTTDGKFYVAGSNFRYSIGLDSTGINYLTMPNGIYPSDVILHCELGGHCTAVTKKGTSRYGYVGHRVDGSMGDGSADDYDQKSFDFTTTPEVEICGVTCNKPKIESSISICSTENGFFTIKGTPGDEITYRLNNGNSETIVLDATGKFEIKIENIVEHQKLEITKFENLVCTENVSIKSSITVESQLLLEIEEQAHNAITVKILGPQNKKFQYQLVDNSGQIIRPFQDNPTFSNINSGIYSIQIKSTETDCIFSQQYMYLNLENVITPNGDGKNDAIRTETLKLLANSKLLLYNRFGDLIGEYNTNTNLFQAPTGTYWYHLSTENGLSKTGWILVKNR